MASSRNLGYEVDDYLLSMEINSSRDIKTYTHCENGCGAPLVRGHCEYCDSDYD